MSNLIASDLQGLSPDSPYIHVYELQISSNPDVWIYLCNEYLDPGAGTKVQFRNRDTPANINTYQVVPCEMEGIERSSDGSLARPSFRVANVFRTLTTNSLYGNIYIANANEALQYKDLLGLKLVRRTTLKKYLYGQPSDQNPPVEYPTEVYYLDRIVEENNTFVEFELVAPFDLQNVQLPRRNIIGPICSWKYQGADPTLPQEEQAGGCIWKRDSTITIGSNTYTAYFNKDDEPIIPAVDGDFTTWAGTADKDDLIKTTGPTLTLIRNEGYTDVASVDYWQCRVDATTDAPADNHPNWQRVWICSNYSSANTMQVFTDDRYNTYVVDGSRLWRAKYRTQWANQHRSSPMFNRYWERGDICGKRVNSCAKRFGFKAALSLPTLGYKTSTEIVSRDLPFGGFPSSRSFE